MIVILLLVLVAVAGAVRTLREVRLDRPSEVPRSHVIDPTSLPPSAVGRPV